MMTPPDEVALLREMLEIDSPSGREAPLAAHILRRAVAAGLAGHIDEVGNVHVKVGEGEPHLLLLGHLDTVPGSWPVTVDDDSISARGVVDAKGSLAAFLCMAARLAEDAPARITVVGAVQEETFGSLGARHVRESYRPDAVVIGEPSGWNGVTVGYKGCTAIEYVVGTAGAHGAGDARPAVEIAVDAWQDVRSACAALSEGRSAFDSWLPRLLSLSTDTDGLNEEARLVISVRTPRDEEALDHVFAAACRHGAYRCLERTPAVLSPKDSVLARSFRVAIRSHGGTPVVKVKTGTSDMNVVGEAWNVPMCAYGPGDASLDHTPHERLSLAEYRRSIDILVAAVRHWARAVPARTSGASA
jgi:LysW-gamma-L-lysine carboxypeptidase